MNSLSSVHHGHISGRPFEHTNGGRVSGSNEHGRISGSNEHGRVSGSNEHRVGGCEQHGRISGTCENGKSGKLQGSNGTYGGSLSGNEQESVEDAALSEISSLIASLGSLSGQAQSMPLSPPTLPGLPQGTAYQPQAIDYSYGDD